MSYFELSALRPYGLKFKEGEYRGQRTDPEYASRELVEGIWTTLEDLRLSATNQEEIPLEKRKPYAVTVLNPEFSRNLQDSLDQWGPEDVSRKVLVFTHTFEGNV